MIIFFFSAICSNHTVSSGVILSRRQKQAIPKNQNERLMKVKSTNQSRTAGRTLSVLSVVAAMALMLCMCGVMTGCGEKEAKPPVVITPSGSVNMAKDYSDIYNEIKKLIGEDTNFTTATGAVGIGMDDAMVDSAPEAREESMKTASDITATYNAAADSAVETLDHSETNTQVSGVDEADILKTDGKYIYILRGNTLTVVDAQSMTELSSVRVDDKEYYSNAQEMYLLGDRIAIVSGYNIYSKKTENEKMRILPIGGSTQFTRLLIYDIADRKAPKQLSVLEQSGNYTTSRMVDGFIYMVTNEYFYGGEMDEEKPETYVPKLITNGDAATVPAESICIFEGATGTCYTVLTAVDINSCEQFSGTRAAFGNSGTVYANTSSMVIACYDYKTDSVEKKIDGKNAVVRTSEQNTKLMLFTLDKGAIKEKASATIPGMLLNQFAMDEHNGYYRFATTIDTNIETVFTDGIDSYEWENTSSNSLFVTDDMLNIVGKIDEMAKDERVYSVRFDGDIAYMVTFRQVDPLFTVDLSDPTNPVVRSELKIPGFSNYLHVYKDGLLFGLGNEADEETGAVGSLKLSMFDVSDPDNVTEKDITKLDYNWSDASYNHKAILINSEKNLIAFPVDDSYVIYGYEAGKGFTKRAEIDMTESSGEWNYFIRGLFIGDSFYICTASRIERYDMDGFDKTGELKLSDFNDGNSWIIME